jgi:hypothetical protein
MAYQGLAAFHDGTGATYARETLIYKVTDTSIEQLGSAIDTTNSTSTFLVPGTFSGGLPNCANIWGQVWAVSAAGLSRYNPGTADDWTLVFDVIAGGAGDFVQYGHGPYFHVENNIPYIVATWTRAITMYWVKYNLLTDSIEASGSLGTPNSGPNISNSVIYKGRLYWIVATTKMAILDMSTGAVSAITLSPAVVSGGSLCTFNGNLYFLGKVGTTTFELYKFTGGLLQSVLTVETVVNAGGAPGVTLFTDGISMYALTFTAAGGNGWLVRQLNVQGDDIVVGPDLTNIVLPSQLRPGGTASVNDSWKVTITSNADGSRLINLWHAPSLGGLYTLYEWIDNDTVMTQIETAGGLTHTLHLANDTQGGGQRNYVPGAPEIVVYGKEAVAGGEKLTFRCFGGQTNQVVRIFLGSGGDAPETQANLIGTVSGGTAFRNGNQIDSVDCDGTTDYTVTVQALGFNNLDFIETIARVSTT